MLKKVLGYGVVGLLAVALVAGLVYILVRPAEAQAERGPLGGQGQGRSTAVEPGTGYRGGGAAGLGGNGGGAYGSGGRGGSRGETAGVGDGVGLDHPAETWITVRGTFVSFDGDLVIETAEGEMVLKTGPAWYWDANGIALDAGDEVVLYGFYDGDDFEVGRVENLTTGEVLALRDETGRPLWAGRGRWEG